MMCYEQKIIVLSSKDKRVQDFCKQICNGDIFYIDVIENCNVIANCHYNVKKYADTNGGDIVFGWAIWQHVDIMLEAEFHSIYKSPSGSHYDITLNMKQFSKILFLRDNERIYDFENNKR